MTVFFVGFPDGLKRSILGLKISSGLHVPARISHLLRIQTPQDVVDGFRHAVRHGGGEGENLFGGCGKPDERGSLIAHQVGGIMDFVEDSKIERYSLQEPDVWKLLVVRPGFRSGAAVLDFADPATIGHVRSVIFRDIGEERFPAVRAFGFVPFADLLG